MLELREFLTDARRKLVDHRFLFNGTKDGVADQASAEWFNRSKQVESFDNFAQLFTRLLGDDLVYVCQRRVGRQRTVTCEERPVLMERNGCELDIFEPRLIHRIEPEHSQIAGEMSEVNIEEKSRRTERVLAKLLDGVNVEGFEDGKDAEMIAFSGNVVEGDRRTVEEDEIDFTLRNGEKSENAGNGGPRIESERERFSPFLRREVIVHLGKTTNGNIRHGGLRAEPNYHSAPRLSINRWRVLAISLLFSPVLREVHMPELPEVKSDLFEETKPETEKITVKAFDAASSYDLRSARELLEKTFGGKTLHASPLLVQTAPQKMTAVFDYGSVVFFNLEPAEYQKMLDALREVAQRPNRQPIEDDFVLYRSPRLRPPEGTDELYIREFNRDIALVVGIVLSRSVSLEYYETRVSNALARLEETVRSLSYEGTIPRRRRDLTKQVGFGLSVEHELAYNVNVFDDPDVVWSGGKKIDQLYKSLKGEFDLEDRIKILQTKISIISRSSTFIISRLEAQRSNFLEWIIIILILSEIVLVLLEKM